MCWKNAQNVTREKQQESQSQFGLNLCSEAPLWAQSSSSTQQPQECVMPELVRVHFKVTLQARLSWTASSAVAEEQSPSPKWPALGQISLLAILVSSSFFFVSPAKSENCSSTSIPWTRIKTLTFLPSNYVQFRLINRRRRGRRRRR